MKQSSGVRLCAFLLAAVCSVLVSLFTVDQSLLERLVIYLSYPGLFATFLIFSYSLFHLHRKEFALTGLIPRRRWAILAILAVSGLLLLYEPFQFKIVYDEPILSIVAQMLHSDRLAGRANFGNDLSGSYHLLQSELDKRPLVFPFLLSLMHDFTGFRYTNVFVLNGILTVVLVSLIYILGKIFSGHRGGLLAVLLAGTLPLLAIFATSGHFEILNLVMLCVVMLLAYLYLKKPNGTRLIPLVFALIILAQVRYENTLYIIPFGVLILLGWKTSRSIILPWQVIIAPFFFIIFSMNYRLILDESTDAFQDGPNGRDATFSIDYAKENLCSAGDYLFSLGQFGSNSYLLSVLGLSAIFGFCLYALRRGKFLSGRDAGGTVMYFYFLSMALFSLVIIFFNYGLFGNYLTSRLSLPLQLLFILLVPFILKRLGKGYVTGTLFFTLLCGLLAFHFMFSHTIVRTGIQFGILIGFYTGVLYWIRVRSQRPMLAFLFIPITYILTVGMPVGHQHRYSDIYKSNRYINKELEFIQSVSETEKIVWLANAPYAAILTKTNVAPLNKFMANPTPLWEYVQDRNCNAVYIPRVFKLNSSREYIPEFEGDYLDPEMYELETVLEYSVANGVMFKIDRLIHINLPSQDPAPEGTSPSPQP